LSRLGSESWEESSDYHIDNLNTYRLETGGILMKAAAALVLLGSLALGQTADPIAEELRATRRSRQVAISPDARTLAWVASAKGDEPKTELWLKPETGPARQLTVGTANCREVAWSPDSQQVAFLASDGSSSQLDLYAAAAAAGEPRRITHLKGFVQAPAWMPGGRQIAVLVIENAARVPAPTQATAVETGVIGDNVELQRLALVDVATGDLRIVSPVDLYVYEFDVSPDGTRVAFTAAPGPGDNNWYIAKLYALDLKTGAAQLLHRPKWQIASPRWSPDGASVAFVEGLMSDEGSTGGDVFLIPAAGGTARNLTPGRPSSPAWIGWRKSGMVLIAEHAGGGVAISELDPETGASETVWRADESFLAEGYDLSLSVADDGRNTALIRTSYTQPPEVWSGEIGKWKQVTDANAGRRAFAGAARSIEWTNGGFTVQGWLRLPPGYDPAHRYPMVVFVHGGPAASVTPAWPGPWLDSALLAKGYLVFEPNPRGSLGRGEAFSRANIRDFGYGDLRDILTGVDRVVKDYPVDEKRIGLAGWSYGGYMAMWAVTQTHRFRAAMAGAGIANWQSYYGQNSIDQWLIPYFGASVYDDPKIYARSSPIEFIKNVKTPTLIVVGERDGECPPPQSYEFWHALQTLGVKNQFVIYPGEGHSFNDPAHTRDVVSRAIDWFEENMR
jgi:dipeptidyl aminopeptidase/acylaminoacyl peptidase